MELKLFVDDIRDPLDNTWIIIRDFDVAIELLSKSNVDLISLDHDLSECKKTGYDIIKWIEEKTFKDISYLPPKIIVHSANPVGKNNIEVTIKSINKIINERDTIIKEKVVSTGGFTISNDWFMECDICDNTAGSYSKLKPKLGEIVMCWFCREKQKNNETFNCDELSIHYQNQLKFSKLMGRPNPEIILTKDNILRYKGADLIMELIMQIDRNEVWENYHNKKIELSVVANFYQDISTSLNDYEELFGDIWNELFKKGNKL